MRKALLAGLFLAGSLTAAPGHAQMSLEEGREAQQLRQSVFELLSFNMEPLADMGRGTVPFDQEKAVLHAERIGVLATMIPEVFRPDTRGSGAYTRAKDFIWDNWDAFEEHARDLEIAAGAMAEAAAAEGAAGVRSNIRNLGGACGACHDLFRFQTSDPGWPFLGQDGS